MRGHRLDVANEVALKVYFRYYQHGPDDTQVDSDITSPLGRHRKVKVFCSSPFCCGNPRRKRGVRAGGLTLREKKAEIDFREQWRKNEMD
jgi:hypothetical protein